MTIIFLQDVALTLTQMGGEIEKLTANQIEQKIAHLTQGVTKYPEHTQVLDAILAEFF